MKIADRVQQVPPSGIRRFFELAEEMDDVISLGVGEPDFSAPWAARTAAIDSLERGKTSYTANKGMRDLRVSIADYVQQWGLDYDPDEEILVTSGASEAVDLAMRAFVDPGDTVAVQEPTYISYTPGIQFAGGEPLRVPTTAENDFQLSYDALRDAGAADAEALVICYPNNPTGATIDDAHLREVAEFAREHDLTVLSDEIYAALTYEGDHTSIATLPGMRERTVVFNGFSKAYAMTGLRLGYALAPPEAIDAMNRIHQYTMLSAPTTAQYAALDALGHDLPVGGDLLNIPLLISPAVVLSFDQGGVPAQARLRTVQDDLFKPADVIVNGYAPLLVVVIFVQLVFEAPATTNWLLHRWRFVEGKLRPQYITHSFQLLQSPGF